MIDPEQVLDDVSKAYQDALELTEDAQAAALLLIAFRLGGIEHHLHEIALSRSR